MIPSPAPITAEDIALLKPYVILPMVQAAFERDSRIFLTFHTPDPYVNWLNTVRKRLSNESKAIHEQAYQQGLQVTKQQHVNGKFLVGYQCRGYFGDIALSDREVANGVVELMRSLFFLN